MSARVRVRARERLILFHRTMNFVFQIYKIRHEHIVVFKWCVMWLKNMQIRSDVVLLHSSHSIKNIHSMLDWSALLSKKQQPQQRKRNKEQKIFAHLFKKHSPRAFHLYA